MMIDVHSHVLPGIDDGCSDPSESIRVLRMMSEQGTDTVFATSHFYASREDPGHFLKRRDASRERLTVAMKETEEVLPPIRCGAEVRYFEGIGHNADIRCLKIEGTDLLLLEMPFTHWTDKILTEVVRLSDDVRIILAHTERYLSYDNMSHLEKLRKYGILFQSNAEIFLPALKRGKALKYLKEGFVDLIASDAHNTSDRPPVTGKAMEYITKKAGEDALMHLKDVQRSLSL